MDNLILAERRSGHKLCYWVALVGSPLLAGEALSGKIAFAAQLRAGSLHHHTTWSEIFQVKTWIMGHA